MTQADELLRELLACHDAPMEERKTLEHSGRIVHGWEAARAYLNEKPHDHDAAAHKASPDPKGRDASPPHAAAEPEKPMNERCEHGVRWEHPCRACDNPNRGPSRDAAAEPVGQPIAWLVPQLRSIADRLRDYSGEREELRNFMANDLTKIADALAAPCRTAANSADG